MLRRRTPRWLISNATGPYHPLNPNPLRIGCRDAERFRFWSAGSRSHTVQLKEFFS